MIQQKMHPLAVARNKYRGHGLTQEALAGLVGLSVPTIKRAERGESVGRYTRQKLREFFDKTDQELGLIRDEDEEKAQNTGNAPSIPTEKEGVSDSTSASPSKSSLYHDVSLSSVLQLSGTKSLLEQVASDPSLLDALQKLGIDMNELRRLLLKEAIALIATSVILPPSELLNPELWKQLDYATRKPSSSAIDEAMMTRFTKIVEGCWHLVTKSGLLVAIPVIEQTLPTYLSKFAALARHPSKFQQTIAGLTAQGYLLASLVALDKLDSPAMDTSSLLAVEYSLLANDQNLHAAALKQQATMFLFEKNPIQALLIYQNVLPFIHQVSSLLQSRAYQGLANASARCGLDEDARLYLNLAHDTFPKNFQDDPSFLYADSNVPTLHLYAGLTYLDLDQPKDAWEAFAQVDGLHPKVAMGDWTRLEFLNLQTKAATAMKDQERSRTYLEASMKLADKLDSRVGRNEAFEAWQQMRVVWSGDPSVKKLSSLFLKK